MNKNLNRKKKICAVLLGCLIGVAYSAPVIAAGKTVYTASPANLKSSETKIYGYYIEPCWVCNNGDIYRVTQYISKHFDQGYTEGADNNCTYTYALVNTCNNCGYGWSDRITRTMVEYEEHH